MMYGVVLAVVSVAGVMGGAWLAVRFEEVPVAGRLVLVGALLSAIAAPVIDGVRPLASLMVGASLGAMVVRLWWSKRTAEKRRARRVFGCEARRQILWNELMGVWPVMLAVTGSVAVVLASTNGQWAGAVSAVAMLTVAAWLLRVSSARDLAMGAPAGDDDLVVTASAGDRARIVDHMAQHQPDVVAVVHPPVLFRGLVGWNLGLGLQAEHAAWAAQIARSAGLDGKLHDAEHTLDAHQAHILVLCRALGGPAGVIVVELDAGLDVRTLRAMAKLISEHRDGRSVRAVTDDGDAGRSFLARSC